MVPENNGVTLGASFKADLWEKYHTAAPRQRRQLCAEWGIEQRFTKPAHPWTNGQVERMNRTLKKATIKRFHSETSAQLDSHLRAFLLAYTFAKRLKRLKGRTPYEFICAEWQKNPSSFHRNPADLAPGPYK